MPIELAGNALVDAQAKIEAVDFSKELDTLERDEIASHMKSEANIPITGTDASQGFYTGQPVEVCGGSACLIQAWIRDNTPYYVEIEMKFTFSASYYRIVIYNQSDLSVAKLFDWEIVTGRDSSTSNFAGMHEIMGTIALRKFAEWADSKINGK